MGRNHHQQRRPREDRVSFLIGVRKKKKKTKTNCLFRLARGHVVLYVPPSRVYAFRPFMFVLLVLVFFLSPFSLALLAEHRTFPTIETFIPELHIYQQRTIGKHKRDQPAAPHSGHTRNDPIRVMSARDRRRSVVSLFIRVSFLPLLYFLPLCLFRIFPPRKKIYKTKRSKRTPSPVV